MSNTLSNETNQRSLKDFLTLYNVITENCFDKCISKFNERAASQDEATCVDVCTDSYVQYNQRFMFNFMDHQERRKRDQERAAAKVAEQEITEQLQLQQAAAALIVGSEQQATETVNSPSVLSPSSPSDPAQAPGSELIESNTASSVNGTASSHPGSNSSDSKAG
ncbi:mitochondrial import inner membrane translocase subunit tim9 [Plakobranchus ocellatus]|uniref:Mitochondrial import inner membrane translocase subunit tim9 n=1 Tax=Plakobranchus ocellatus TaxID=259542 RepID=A0AAV3YDY3_9GAST|nr:mitochondrial import inner membrane translocase subunit tim9 [Plakobranchus ocellatus]